MTKATDRVVGAILETLTDIVENIGSIDLERKYADRMKALGDELGAEIFGSPVRSRPVRFAGSEGERIENRESHKWTVLDSDLRCFTCDAKVGHAAADYPCGAEVPRVSW